MISLELNQSCFHGGGPGGRLPSTEVTEGTERPGDGATDNQSPCIRRVLPTLS